MNKNHIKLLSCRLLLSTSLSLNKRLDFRAVQSSARVVSGGRTQGHKQTHNFYMVGMSLHRNTFLQLSFIFTFYAFLARDAPIQILRRTVTVARSKAALRMDNLLVCPPRTQNMHIQTPTHTHTYTHTRRHRNTHKHMCVCVTLGQYVSPTTS